MLPTIFSCNSSSVRSDRGCASVWRGFVRLAALALVIGAMGCGVSVRAFVPGEHVTAVNPRGDQYAAEYAITEGGRLLGEVKVWTNGASRETGEGGTLIEVGFEVVNHADGPLRLDPKAITLDEVTLRDDRLRQVEPTHVDGDPSIAPGEDRIISVTFELPGDIWPDDVLGYRVAWRLTNGVTYSQKTPFFPGVDWRDRDPWYPRHPAYYNGYYPGPYWGWPYYRYRVWPPPWRYRPYHYPFWP